MDICGMKTQVYVEGLGYRNPKEEREQIMWWMDNYTKNMNKPCATKYWLNALERLENRLLELQAYELLEFLKGRVTERQKKNREQWRIKSKQNAILEMAKVDWWQQYKVKRDLIQQIRLN